MSTLPFWCMLATSTLITIIPISSAPVKCDLKDVRCVLNGQLDRLIKQAQSQQGTKNTSSIDPVSQQSAMDVKCFACLEAIDLVRMMFQRGTKTKAVEKFVTYICKVFDIETTEVCDEVVSLFGEEVFYVIEHLVLNPQEVCSLIIKDCGSWYNPFDRWNITLPDVPKPVVVPPQLPPPGSPVVRILHISDLHYDASYQPGAPAVCNEPLCCRSTSTRKGNETAGYWGYRGDCDVPYWTVENMLQHITEHEKFDYVYWTGDLPAHNIWEQTRESQINIYKNMTALFLQYFKDKPVFSALGNHESAPVDSFPPPFITGNMSITWLYDELEQSWTNWVSKQQTTADIKKGAYYTTMIEPGLRLISINTNYCNSLNFWLLLNDTDPTGELRWLADTLQQAEDNMEKVHIIGHIPPGISDCLRSWSYNYYKIVNRYESTIAGQFYGHTHYDHYQLFYDVRDLLIDVGEYLKFTPHGGVERPHHVTRRPVGVIFIAPSVTTFQDVHPGYRIYTVDGFHKNTTRMVLDHETYVMNVTDANIKGNKPEWKLEYSAKDAFGLPSLFPEDFDRLVDKLARNDHLWKKWLSYYYKGSSPPCDNRCREEMLCALRTGSSYDTSFC